MFLCPSGWHEWRGGDRLIYTPRTGAVQCVMTYRERVRPVRAFPKLLHDVLAADPELVIEEKNKITRFITDEGEYAALIVVRGHFRGRPIGHVVAAIYTEEFTTLVDARVETAVIDEYAQRVLELVKSDRLELGLRRRRVAFKPPAGWHVIPGTGLDVTLLPPDYPKVHASITVEPAHPLAQGFDPHEFAALHDQAVGLVGGSETRKLAEVNLLHGDEWEMVRPLPDGQGKLVRHLVVLRDERYTYAAKLEALEGNQLPNLMTAFHDLVRSFQPVPAPLQARNDRGSIFEIWTD